MPTSRLEAFSDGVFAIAITLLIIEVRPPDSAPGELAGDLVSIWPSYAAYVVSFAIIGIIWVNHHQVFAGITTVDRALLFLNLVLLLTVAFLPFPTALLGEYIRDGDNAHIAAAVYGANMTMIGLAFIAMWTYLARVPALLAPKVGIEGARRARRAATIGPVLYALTIPLAFLSPWRVCSCMPPLPSTSRSRSPWKVGKTSRGTRAQRASLTRALDCFILVRGRMLGCTNRSGCRIGHEHEELAYDAGVGAVRREPISKGIRPPLPLRDHPGDFQARLRLGRQSARMRTSQTSLEATMTEIIEGPITATDRVYAFDKIRALCPRALSPVRRARARLTARPHPTGSWPVTAECTLVLEDGMIVSAGAIGSSVRDAVDELTTRLRRRLAAPAPSVRHAHGGLRLADRIRTVR
jgi:TMEM175 potassium channel family protein